MEEKNKFWPWGTDDNSWKYNIVHIGVPIAKYVDKLVAAWEKYGKIRICVDFDDTLLGHETWNKEICKDVCQTVIKAQKLGAVIILWTCRLPENIEQNLIVLNEMGLHFDEINPSKPFKEKFSNKPYCNIMLDDKCGLDQALWILKYAIEIYESKTTIKSNESSRNDREHDV